MKYININDYKTVPIKVSQLNSSTDGTKQLDKRSDDDVLLSDFVKKEMRINNWYERS